MCFFVNGPSVSSLWRYARRRSSNSFRIASAFANASLSPRHRDRPRPSYPRRAHPSTYALRSSAYTPSLGAQYRSFTRASTASASAPCFRRIVARSEVSRRRSSGTSSLTGTCGSIFRSARTLRAPSGRPEIPTKYGITQRTRASSTGAEIKARPRSRERTFRLTASSNSAALRPENPPRCCMSPIAPAIATPARSQFRSSRARVNSHVVVAPHASRVPSTPNRAGFTWTTFSESRRGAWWSRTIAGHGRPSTRSSWPAPALVREVRAVGLDVPLQVDGPLHEAAEVLRDFPREPLPRQDLGDGLPRGEVDVRDRVRVPEAGADRGLRGALPVELHDDFDN